MDGSAAKLSPKKVLKVGDMEKLFDPAGASRFRGQAKCGGGACVWNFRKDLLKKPLPKKSSQKMVLCKFDIFLSIVI